MVLCLSGSYGNLLDYVIFASLLFYFFTVLALFRLRRTQPDLPRPVKAFGYPVLPGVYLVAVLVKLTGIASSVAFNLAIPTVFALAVVNVWSLAYNLALRVLPSPLVPLPAGEAGIRPGYHQFPCYHF